jgi:chloramphenicol O-acetyltransferase type A
MTKDEKYIRRCIQLARNGMYNAAPNPMVTFFKKIDVTNLVHISRKYKWKFNMLLCWCIGRAAGEVKEFYMLPVDGKLYKYERL